MKKSTFPEFVSLLAVTLVMAFSLSGQTYATHQEEEEKVQESVSYLSSSNADALNKEYSNDLPKIKKIASKKIPITNMDWEKEYRRFHIMAEKMIGFFSNADYSFIPGGMRYSDENCLYLYKKEKDVVALLCHYHQKNNGITLNHLKGEKDDLNPFSFQYLSRALKGKMTPKKSRDKHDKIEKLSNENQSVLELIKGMFN